jgi:hypothetical protein
MAMPSLGHRLFNGPKLGCWLLLSLIYSLAIGLFHKPILFSGLHFSWFFNPHVGYLNDTHGIVGFFYLRMIGFYY